MRLAATGCFFPTVRQPVALPFVLLFVAEFYDLRQHLRANPDGSSRCTICNLLFKNMTTGRQHFKIAHEPPEYYQCCFCQKVLRTKIIFRSHIYQKHGVRGRDIVNSYGQRVDPPEGSEGTF